MQISVAKTDDGLGSTASRVETFIAWKPESRVSFCNS